MPKIVKSFFFLNRQDDPSVYASHLLYLIIQVFLNEPLHKMVMLSGMMALDGLNNAKLPLIKANPAAATAEFPHLPKQQLKLTFSVRDQSCRW